MLYITVVTVILLSVVWFMPKQMERRDILIIWITVSYIEIVVDLILGHIMGYYYFAGDKKISPEVVATKLIMAPLFGIIILNYMPKKVNRFIPYWFLWATFSTLFEWTTIKFGYLTYKNWELWYSAVFYILIIPVIRWFYYYTKH